MQRIPRHLEFANGLQLELRRRGDQFLGIGAVRFAGTRLRSGQLPWTFYTESDRGVRFEDYRLVKVVKTRGGGKTIVFTAPGRWLPRIQDADALGDARIKTRRGAAPRATFRWSFRPITERLWENEWQGLAMQLEVASPGVPLHWLIEDTTWEIGGAAAGCTLIQQDVSTIDLEQRVKRHSAFSTTEKFFTGDGWGGSFPMDMLPRAAGAAICDFQAKDDLALCLFAERPGLTRARLEKFAAENLIHHTDRPFFPLTEKARLPERKLLVYRYPRKLRRHEWRNLWLDCFTEVRRRIHRTYGFKLEVPEPSVSAHLWDADLKAYGRTWSLPLKKALPEYARLGYRQVFTHGVWESVTSDASPKVEGNICCPYAYRFAKPFGGAAGMRRLNAAARAAGIRMFQWFAFHLSRYAPVWQEHPDWVLREANGDPWDGAYQILWSGRMRSGYGQKFLRQIKQVKTATGIAGIFWDSYQNLGVTCVDWQGQDKAPQAEEIWRMQAELQRFGYRQRCEVVTIFGVSAVAMYGFENDRFRRRLWADTVRNDDGFALLDCSPGFFSEGDVLRADKLSPALYFWLAGHRALPGAGARPWGKPQDPEQAGPPWPGGALAEEYARVNHLYNAVLPHMHRLRVVAGGTHALWLNKQNAPSVIWAFRDATIEYAGSVLEVETVNRSRASGRLEVKAGHVYQLSRRG